MITPIVTAENAAKRDLSWIAHHLILVGVLLVTLFLGVYSVEALIEKHDEKKSQQANVALQVVVDQVKKLEDHQAQNDAAVAQREAARDALIQSLVATIAKRDAALDQQIKKNATLTAQQAAARLTEQYKAQPGEIVANGDNILADLPTARSFVNTFDQLSACTANYSDTQKQLATEQARTADLKTQVGDRDNTIKGKDEELVKQKGKYEADIVVLKAQARKGKMKWYAAGVVTGLGLKYIFKFATGI
jgi:hypothetical protein